MSIMGERNMSFMELEYLKQIDEANEKIQKLAEALRFYAYADIHKYHRDNGEMARDCLKEIRK